MNRRSFLLATAILSALPARTRANPIRAATVNLTHPDGRTTHVRIMVPRPQDAPAPVVLFSHGANATGYFYDAILQPLCDAGFVVLTVDHLDAGGPAAPESVPPKGLFNSRVADLALPLSHTDQIDSLCRGMGVDPDWQRTCVMGHSFGAVVAMSLAGATVVQSLNQKASTNPHPAIGAVITVSPPGPREGLVPLEAWGSVAIPSLTITGTDDILPGFIDDWRQHIAGYEIGSDGRRWQVVGQGVDHYFGGLICRLSEGPKAEAQRPALVEANAVIRDFMMQWASRLPPTPSQTEYCSLELQMI